MKKSEIKFIVSLDEKNIPEKIEWVAEDSLSQDLKESKSISLHSKIVSIFKTLPIS